MAAKVLAKISRGIIEIFGTNVYRKLRYYRPTLLFRFALELNRGELPLAL
jgi:hypothetical protein